MKTIKTLIVTLAILALMLVSFIVFSQGIIEVVEKNDFTTIILSVVLVSQILLVLTLWIHVSPLFLKSIEELKQAKLRYENKYEKDEMYIEAVKRVATTKAGITVDEINKQYNKLKDSNWKA